MGRQVDIGRNGDIRTIVLPDTMAEGPGWVLISTARHALTYFKFACEQGYVNVHLECTNERLGTYKVTWNPGE